LADTVQYNYMPVAVFEYVCSRLTGCVAYKALSVMGPSQWDSVDLVETYSKGRPPTPPPPAQGVASEGGRGIGTGVFLEHIASLHGNFRL
jgi:hypothetical protein